ncbi:hypothetical protein P8605_09195 [Streptomyces sp. T-3]|nr:hypothetical protein [Streptomyces sp. T-3]
MQVSPQFPGEESWVPAPPPELGVGNPVQLVERDPVVVDGGGHEPLVQLFESAVFELDGVYEPGLSVEHLGDGEYLAPAALVQEFADLGFTSTFCRRRSALSFRRSVLLSLFQRDTPSPAFQRIKNPIHVGVCCETKFSIGLRDLHQCFGESHPAEFGALLQ